MPLSDQTPAGVLISFEGSEGSGKTTQIARLAKRLQAMGRDVISTREPGGSEIGEQIRNIIVHNSKGDEMCAETELLLFAAARAQLVREAIAPALLRGAIVLSDRFLDSSTVYQGIGRNLAMGPVNQINRFAVGNVMPHLTIVIDVPTSVSLERIRQRASDLPDRMERENIDFYEKVRSGYLLLAKGMPERFVVIDGTQSEDAIEKQIWAAIEVRLFKKSASSSAKKKLAKPAKKKTPTRAAAKKAPARATKSATKKTVARKPAAKSSPPAARKSARRR
jgi:thymidylate kinase